MYEQFKIFWWNYYYQNIDWCRRGQAVMNCLPEYSYGTYLKVKGTGMDCYEDDTRLRSCLDFIKSELES